MFVGNWLVPFCMKTNILTGNKTEFVSKRFAGAPVRLKIMKLTTITIHQEANCNVDHFNQTAAAHF